MKNYNYNIKMKNNKENLIKFYSLIVKTKMTIFLACKIKKYRIFIKYEYKILSMHINIINNFDKKALFKIYSFIYI